MQVCKNCRKLFDPTLALLRPDSQPANSASFLCSHHPGELEFRAAGPSTDFHDVYEWNCCGAIAFSAVNTGGYDVAPGRSPGCKTLVHIADPETIFEAAIASELKEVAIRLRGVERMELLPNISAGVFVSYSHADSAFVDRLSDRLAADKIEYWRDAKDLLIGDSIDRAISNGIQRHCLFLVVLSRSSIASKWVSREIDEASHEASEGTKVLLPVLAGGLTAAELPSRLRRFKCANFNTNFESNYKQLKVAIVGHLNRISPPAASQETPSK
jgi:hypothetical protein